VSDKSQLSSPPRTFFSLNTLRTAPAHLGPEVLTLCQACNKGLLEISTDYFPCFRTTAVAFFNINSCGIFYQLQASTHRSSSNAAGTLHTVLHARKVANLITNAKFPVSEVLLNFSGAKFCEFHFSNEYSEFLRLCVQPSPDL